MKKLIYLIVLALILGLILTGCEPLSKISQVPATEQMKVKPEGNLAGAEEVGWNLSGAVMPVPPYGSFDIEGSDIASKLIVNQPNGNVEVTVTGVMKGLDPNTTYTVILSNEYTPYVFTGWDVTGNWILAFNSTLWPSGNPYMHDMAVTDGNATGGTPAGGPSYVNWWNANVSVIDDSVTIVATYQSGSSVFPYTLTAIGTISSLGTISGSWSDTISDSGLWTSTNGKATNHTGDTGWSGAFNSYPRFTFLTDEYGAGSWHFNLRDEDFGEEGTFGISVWINQNNPNATILISDSFTVVVD